MPQPGDVGGIVPPGADWVSKKLADLQRQIDALVTARSGNAMTIDGAPGITVQSGGQINLDGGDLTVTAGDIVAAGGNVMSGGFAHGSAGWRLQPGGNAEFNDITLRGGIIGDDALTNPISAAVAHQQADSFSLTTTAVQKARSNITPPSGFTRALVMGTITANARNTTAGQDFFDGYCDINGVTFGWDASNDAAPGYSVAIAHTATALLTGLTGAFYVRAMLRSGLSAWGADSFNAVNVDTLILFLR